MFWLIKMFGEKSSILGSKTHMLLSHQSILPTLRYIGGDVIGVVEVCFG